MLTTETYSREFWNSMRSKKFDGNILCEGANHINGSYFLPEKTAEKYEAALAKENLFRRIATFVKATKYDGSIIVSDSPVDAGWVVEGEKIPEAELSTNRIALKAHMLACISVLDSNFVHDTGFNIEDYLTRDFARIFGKAEENAFINGDGIDKPKGVLHATKGADIGLQTASATTISFDEIHRLYFSLKAEYRSNAVWVMNDETALTLRNLKDNTGNYLWRGAADTLLGKAVIISNHMPSVKSGSKPIIFGDFKYYWVALRQPLSIRALHESYSFSDKVGYCGIERLDGCLIRTEAIKALKMA